MFFGNTNSKINSKWNINDFVVGNKNRQVNSNTLNSSGIKSNDLGNTIAKITTKFTKTELEMTSVYKELINKRKEIRASCKLLSSNPEMEALFQRLDVDLINSTMKVIETKGKVISDMLKHIRDEKKLALDIQKITAPIATTTTETFTDSSSPLGVVSAVNNNHSGGNDTPMIRSNSFLGVSKVNTPQSQIMGRNTPPVSQNRGTTNVSNPQQPASSVSSEAIFDASTEEVPGEVEETPPQQVIDTVPDIPAVANVVTPNGYDSIAVNNNWDGSINKTLSDVNAERAVKVSDRLARKSEILNGAVGPLGLSYGNSIKVFKNKTLEIQPTLFIDRTSGQFYVQQIETTPEGVVRQAENPVYPSLMKLGELKINAMNAVAQSPYIDGSMKVVVVNDTTDMPSYYKEAWNSPTSSRFTLKDEVLDTLS